ncbi:MAG: hypothetical protein VB015_01785 [Erysipelotrichaceae bacterium]|nr:hypothetical protein [Erysipelotrichaceae bacterium]
MKFELTPSELKKIIEIIKTSYQNIDVANFYNEYLNNYYDQIDESTILKGNEEGSFYRSLIDCLGIEDDDKEFNEIEEKYHLEKMTLLDVRKYLNNPYYKNIQIIPTKNKKWTLGYNHYLPYEGFVYDDTTIEGPNYKEITHFGFFNQKFEFIEVKQNQKTWMSITPHEINTMEDPINNAKGHVLVYGLGLGYFPYMCSLKDEVSKITIVENSKDAIELFKNEIFNKFQYKNKIEIIEADALKFAKDHIKSSEYDFVFTDLWHDANDGLSIYLKMKRLENKNAMNSYWIETTLKAMLRRLIITVIEEGLNNLDDSAYQNASNDYDRLINEIYFKTKNRILRKASDLNSIEEEIIIG